MHILNYSIEIKTNVFIPIIKSIEKNNALN